MYSNNQNKTITILWSFCFVYNQFMTSPKTKILKIVGHILAIGSYIAALVYAFIFSSFTGVFGDGLFGVEPDLVEYLPAVLVLASIFVVFFTYKRYQTLPIWASAVVILASIYVLA